MKNWIIAAMIAVAIVLVLMNKWMKENSVFVEEKIEQVIPPLPRGADFKG